MSVVLDTRGASLPPGAVGRIPAFVGSDRAAEMLAGTQASKAARVIKANPDKAQLPVRLRALADGKTVYMAVPKLARPDPFYLLDPEVLGDRAALAATGDGAARMAPTVAVEQMRAIDLVVCGSVAVNRAGVRIGKGAGYSDIEVALLIEAGLLIDGALLTTTVHGLQVVERNLPACEHDFRLDFIVTPDEVIACSSPHRPAGFIASTSAAKRSPPSRCLLAVTPMSRIDQLATG